MPWVLSQVNRKCRSWCGADRVRRGRRRRRSGRAGRGRRGCCRASSSWTRTGGRRRRSAAGDVQGEGLLEGGGEGDDAVLAALALGDPDAAAVEVDVVEADADQFADPHAGVEQGLDEDDVAGPAGLPDDLVVAADLGFGGDVGQFLGLARDLDAQLGAQVPEDLLEVGVVGPFVAQVLGELTRLALGRCPLRPAAAGAGSRGGSGSRSRWVSHVEVELAVGGDVAPEQWGERRGGPRR